MGKGVFMGGKGVFMGGKGVFGESRQLGICLELAAVSRDVETPVALASTIAHGSLPHHKLVLEVQPLGQLNRCHPHVAVCLCA
jgi:hypothetical protein